MAFNTKTLKRFFLLLAILALGAGLYVVWLQTDKADVQAMSKLCYEILNPHIDPAAFRGMDRFGEPPFALAMAAKRDDYRYWDWVSLRGDIRQTIDYLESGEFNCLVFDNAGHVIGAYSTIISEKISIWERSGPDDAPVLTRAIGQIVNGELTLIRGDALRLGVEEGEIERVLLFGDDAGKRWIELRYVYDNEARTLFLDSQLEDRLTISANGQRLSKDYRSCYHRDEPCEYTYETMHYEYDAHGNMIRRQYQYGGDDYDDHYTIEKNARGDWISSHPVGTDKNTTSRRVIDYWAGAH